jgi:hypothetical protein
MASVDRIINEYEADGEIGMGGGNQNARRKLTPVLFRQSQIPNDLTWDRIQTTM